MWNSGGDINNQTVQVVDPGDMHVTGLIEGESTVVLESTGGSITIDGKIDGNSHVSLKAAQDIMIGPAGGTNKEIDGNSAVDVVAGRDIAVGGYIHKATVDLSAHGEVTLTEIGDNAIVRVIADGEVSLTEKIDEESRTDLVSNRGSITIDGKIDGSSNAHLSAAGDIILGQQGNAGDRKIAGNSFVAAMAGKDIVLGGPIEESHTKVDFAAAGSISIENEISGGATVRLLSGTGKIGVAGNISGNSTEVIFFPAGALAAPNPQGGAVTNLEEWAAAGPLNPTADTEGYWWENWGQTFGYLAPFRVLPRSVEEIAAALVEGFGKRQPTPIKAVGGGWSFTDAALPFKSQPEVDQASIKLRGAWQRQDVRRVLDGLTDDTSIVPMDLLPEAVARNSEFSTTYDQANLRQATNSGTQLPSSAEVRIIDTRSLASSLNCEFPEIAAPPPQQRSPYLKRRPILFHVEAGITMADLQQLLDHQHPRLALQATGGSPGATLAGTISTATHGGEFKWPLLVDRVRAIHLVGPGGEQGGQQWWIEGDLPVADQVKLQQRYPAIDAAHFIDAGWNAIPGLTGQDVLKAAAVSMGTMGVIYSVVLEVVPQFGLRQIVHPTNWTEILAAAQTTEQELRASDTNANTAVLEVLMDGAVNGTGIAKANNVYADLAINPFNHDCWVINREVTPELPDDANSPSLGIGDYLTSLSRALSGNAVDSVEYSKFAGRIFDFLHYATDWPNPDDVVHDVEQALRLAAFAMALPDPLVGALAASSARDVLNAITEAGDPDRGQQFLGDALTGFFHALEGTAPGLNSDATAVAYQVGAIGWPDGGLPGRGVEIALDPTNAFTFLQTVLFDDILANTMKAGNNPLLGYVSVRVCPTTETLLGMQQYAPNSVMIEVVAYRSPQGNTVMDLVQEKTLKWAPAAGPRPLLHWGLENDKVTNTFLAGTPLGQVYSGAFTRLQAFAQIRQYLRGGFPPVFDNNFTARVGI
ncbi:MAG: hypothetical protein ACLQBB_03855 [Solirubrobacteraceae bacterium]